VPTPCELAESRLVLGAILAGPSKQRLFGNPHVPPILKVRSGGESAPWLAASSHRVR
jgi:hypothetical protein